ncbi:hypothetical protein CDD80_4282 [Ophiocordyceps camponoti-rufipedis]|uniref:Uncharacterized protein n=1 Tax=Ophiocordyceps camponoti-rufipedis TaxID=2004952 RepID=A0A2C5XHN6_9HYPO|nr:hypothetical protein CDD80_4282 [Ophiocordyceps camponoti-rufipedis]
MGPKPEAGVSSHGSWPNDGQPESVPHYPEEDSKLRATSLSIRRGGNCANALEVLQQLLRQDEGGGRHVRPHLVSVLPSRSSTATGRIRASFGDAPLVDLSHCLYRHGHDEPAASYIIRSQATTSRTIVNHMDLPEMTTDEFAVVIDALAEADSSWWHFEVRLWPKGTKGKGVSGPW